MHKLVLLVGGFACVFVVSVVEGQLDLPSMPGPPYPDPRGQNRWGVKFDPRKHGPPYDLRGRGSGAYPRHRRPPASFQEDDRDSRVSPAMQSFKKHRNHGHSRSNPFYGNELSSNRPNYNKYYGNGGRNLNSNGQAEFWNAWNSQYKKKPEPYKYKSPSPAAGESAKPQKEESGPNKYWKMLKSMWTGNVGSKGSEKGNLAGDSSAFGYEIDIAFPKKPSHHQRQQRKPKQAQHWRVFTTLGRGLDAVHGGVRTVRKAVLGTSGSVFASGAKLGGKVAVFGVKKVANVGASILANKMLEKAVATAIATAG